LNDIDIIKAFKVHVRVFIHLSYFVTITKQRHEGKRIIIGHKSNNIGNERSDTDIRKRSINNSNRALS